MTPSTMLFIIGILLIAVSIVLFIYFDMTAGHRSECSCPHHSNSNEEKGTVMPHEDTVA